MSEKCLLIRNTA